MVRACVVFALVCAAVLVAASTQPLVVDTNNGKLQGLLTESVRQFLGIPFAQPPIGDLRFKRPVAPSSWEGVRSALENGPDCAQPYTGYIGNWNTSEDCLYLNIYTPSEISQPLPIMVFFYGGSWEWGGTSLPVYNGIFIVEGSGEQVIVATVNYRLGPFGWIASQALAEEDEYGSTGNYGLQDQRAAVQWITANAASFGGDPTRVTIWGESAGGGSVSCHLASKFSNGTFHRAIIESGPPAEWTTIPLKVAEDHYNGIVGAVGCNATTNNPQDILACLRTKSTNDLLNNEAINQTTDTPFVPVIDGVELTDRPEILIQHGQYNRVPVLFGSNKNEGTLFVTMPHDATDEEYHDTIYSMFGDKLAPTILELYPPWNYTNAWWAYSEIVGDLAMSCPVRRVARFMNWAENPNPVFTYFFTHEPIVLLFNPWLGVCHASELVFVFDFPLLLLGKGEPELGSEFVKYWTNFAIYGDPNGDGTNPPAVAWPQYFPGEDENMQLTVPAPFAQSGLKKPQCDFWDQVYNITHNFPPPLSTMLYRKH